MYVPAPVAVRCTAITDGKHWIDPRCYGEVGHPGSHWAHRSDGLTGFSHVARRAATGRELSELAARL